MIRVMPSARTSHSKRSAKRFVTCTASGCYVYQCFSTSHPVRLCLMVESNAKLKCRACERVEILLTSSLHRSYTVFR